MTAGLLVYALGAGGLVAAACWAGEALARPHGRATRWIWGLGMAATVLLTARGVVYGVLDGEPTTPLALVASSASPAATEAPGLGNAIRASYAAAGAALRELLVTGARLVPEWLARGALLAWLAASAAALGLVAIVHLRIRLAQRRWPRARLLGHDVRIAPSVGPAVVGVLQATIVVPRWLLARSDDEQRLVLVHEGEHVRARDHLLLTGGWLAVAMVPWNPAAWWMLARLRLAIELDCDARVLRRGVTASAYGSLLIDLAGQCSGITVGATALADEGSHLKRRLLAMNPITSRHMRVRSGVLGAAALLALLAACEAKVPTSAEIDAMDAAGAQRLTAPAMDGHLASSTFYVNGVEETPERAHAITPNQIAEVTVEKGAGGRSTIRITTNGAAAAGPAEAGALRRAHNAMAGAIHGDTSVTIRTPGHTSGVMSGLIFIDGVRADAATLHRLDPKTFVSVDVIKGAEATKRYADPAAANGVIQIRTRRGQQ